MEGIEEAFSCFLVHRYGDVGSETAKQELQNVLSGLPPDQQEGAVKQYISMAATMTNHSQLQLLLNILEQLVASAVVPARYFHFYFCTRDICAELQENRFISVLETA